MPNQQGNKKKKKIWKVIFLIIFSTVVVCGLASAIFIYVEISKIKKYEPEATIAPQDEIFETEDQAPITGDVSFIDPNDVLWPEGIEPISGMDFVNILLIGQDRRSYQTRQRSDTIIILSYNIKLGTIKLISLMRDTYVQIPGYSDNE
jgi:anionic cell wall polymer biosynthesis LytR-Cps2A-Psr (LCP) family protein